jgi:catechol 2,3-dioxygenase-like lactoylglutathione lyase family enzyme
MRPVVVSPRLRIRSLFVGRSLTMGDIMHYRTPPALQVAERGDDRMAAAVRVTGLDHIVLLTPDVERSLAFYTGVLGIPGERVEEWRRGEVFFPSFRIDATTVVDVMVGERTGVNVDHLCLVVEPLDFEELAASGILRVATGPVPRWGAQGIATSLYVLDPDDNTVELRYYP